MSPFVAVLLLTGPDTTDARHFGLHHQFSRDDSLARALCIAEVGGALSIDQQCFELIQIHVICSVLLMLRMIVEKVTVYKQNAPHG